MNTLPVMSESHDQEAVSHDKPGQGRRRGSVREEAGKRGKEEANSSLLQQVSNLFGWSRLGLGGRGAGNTGEIHRGADDSMEEAVLSGGEMGLAGIL